MCPFNSVIYALGCDSFVWHKLLMRRNSYLISARVCVFFSVVDDPAINGFVQMLCLRYKPYRLTILVCMHVGLRSIMKAVV
jgi:hypothetical protein